MTVASVRRSANHWPGLDVVPAGPRAAVSARVARRLFAAAVNRLDVTVHVGGETLGRGGPAMTIHRPEEFYARIGRHQLIGFGEAYLTGAWDTARPEDLGDLPRPCSPPICPPWCPSGSRSCARWSSSARRVARRAAPRTPATTSRTTTTCPTTCSSCFLDPTLSYSSAMFPEHLLGGDRPAREDLEAAQDAKIDRLLDQARVGEGTRVLEIGSGWGELAIRAAQRGATVRTITLVGRAEGARRRADRRRRRERVRAGQISVELCDYRDAGRPASSTTPSSPSR